MCLLATYMSSLKTFLFKSCAHFWLDYCWIPIFFIYWILWTVYILDNKSLLIVSFTKSFYHSIGCLSVLLTVSIAVQKLLGLIKSNLFIFSEKAMAPHSSTFAWKIPWTEKPGGLQSMGSRRVGHDWETSLSLSLSTLIHWRRKWQPTLVFLPGESQGQGSLVGCRLWGRTESDRTEAT